MAHDRSRTLDKRSAYATLNEPDQSWPASRDLAYTTDGIGTHGLSHSVPLSLSHHNVHVWTVPTDSPDVALASFEKILSADERHRANRLVHPQRRMSFVLARATLRCILGQYLRIAPEAICFLYGCYGKPALNSSSPIQFNLTYADGLAVIGVATHCSVGIDVERIRDLADLERVAERFFTFPESARISSLPLPARRRAFFHCWTRKEAYLKADGRGLSLAPNSFELEMFSGQTGLSQEPPVTTVDPRLWTVQELPSTPDYSAALAHSGAPRAWSLFSVSTLTSLSQITYRCADRVARHDPPANPVSSGLRNDAPAALPHMVYTELLSQ